ncbi:class I SAM-dependent methyltransferase [Candidatus Wolfebacteria bacterium]|nr:class I SAM-dependent methyltransferase [Candidatus Wolfebacteria bacterium]
MCVKSIKRILRKSRIVIGVYYCLKSILVFPLKFTSLKPFADTTFPLRELFKPSKLYLFKTVSPYTRLKYATLSNVYDLANDIERRKAPGAYVECGVWKGGGAAVMGAVAKKFGSERMTWYFDSFEGMPEPTEKDKSGRGKKWLTGDIMGDVLKASVADVEEVAYYRLNLSRDKNIIIKGWFQDTLPKTKQRIGQIAILRLDGDWYESTMTALTELYDQVVQGGYVIIDDYGAWEGCRRAVHEFLDNRSIKPDLKFIGTYDPGAFSKTPPAYFQKPS